ncbi:hypothetical protein [Natrarchaeobaculum sulfurireducens]|uniref:hypothetical protein n=1 Tax=Natrarchaeobaculum sulfurireducens TaxID=2044521 RepID=UPI00105AB084|nr:hypothetical protein [Natrarchaeobaculum sulfurireducens]
MWSLKRWQYPWMVLALLLMILSAAGYLLYDIGTISLFPLIVGIGMLVIVVKPRMYGSVMVGIGVLSIFTSLISISLSPLSQGVLIIIGIVAILAGIQSQRNEESDQ